MKSAGARSNRDAVYGRDFLRRAQRIGIDAIATPMMSSISDPCWPNTLPTTTASARIARLDCRHRN
jgi:hypothetical protein